MLIVPRGACCDNCERAKEWCANVQPGLYDDEDEDDEYGEGDEDVFEFRDDFDGLDENEQEDDTIDQESIAPLRPGADELHPELDLDRPRGGRSLAASRRYVYKRLQYGS